VNDFSTTSDAAGLLAGVRVLDVTNVLAGPFAGYQLALMGADVVKVETPGSGDLARQLGASPQLSEQQLGVSFLAQNSGKRSVTVNLKSAGGRDVFARLVAGADVLIENIRPGVLERLGFGWPRLRELNTRLIYCAVSGFGAPLRPVERQHPHATARFDNRIQRSGWTRTWRPDDRRTRPGSAGSESPAEIEPRLSVRSGTMGRDRR